MKTVWNEERLKTLHECIAEGMCAAKIATILCVSPCTVREYCNKNNLPLKRKSKNTLGGRTLGGGGRKKADEWYDDKIPKDVFMPLIRHIKDVQHLKKELGRVGCHVNSYRIEALLKAVGVKAENKYSEQLGSCSLKSDVGLRKCY